MKRITLTFIKGTIGSVLMILTIANSSAAQSVVKSQLFEAYQKDKSNAILPDFSYAGYRSGEVAIPDIKSYKVFNVVDFGAKPNDDVSDQNAIQMAVLAANANGSGIVFFPKGRFLVNEDTAQVKGIVSKGSKIIFRGSGAGPGGTELFMKEMLAPVNPQQMWTGRPMFTFTAGGKDIEIGQIQQIANIGDFELTLDKIGALREGDWIVLKMLNNSTELINETLAKHELNPNWKDLINKGVNVSTYYQVVKIKGQTIRLHAPIAIKIDPKHKWTVAKFANAEEVGVEDIAFVGNWKDKFVHHRSWEHDSGYHLLMFSRLTNSWVRNCRFTDCNVAAIVGQSANISIINCEVTGNGGHEAITANHATNVLLANLKDEASQFHSFGSSHGAVNTVIWRCTYPSTTSFESHANQPRNTLLDNVTGGLYYNRGGGAIENLPNHLQGLVFWNYTQTNAPIKDFNFWPEDKEYVWFKIVQPIIAGFTSKGTTFKTENLGYLEGLDQKISPASLYEAQLQLRLGQQFTPFAQQTQSKAPLKSEHYISRFGDLANTLYQIKTKKSANVVFYGGSITFNPGWRDKVSQYLQETYPATKFNFLNAGIPSLGSLPHAFRINQDVLSKGKVDLLFLETAVNDHGNGTNQQTQRRALEGIIRHTLKANPHANIVMMAFVDPDKIKEYNQGKIPAEVQLHQDLAKLFHLPFINLAKEVTDRINAGEFTWARDFKDLHPSPFGQEIYFRTIKQLLLEDLAKSTPAKIKPSYLPKQIAPFAYIDGNYLSINQAKALNGFTLNPSWKPADNVGTREGFVNVPMLVGEKAGDSFELPFSGQVIGLGIIAGPDAGKIKYSIDGKEYPELELFSPWSNSLHLPWYLLLDDELTTGKHLLKLEISANKNNRSKGTACRIVYFLATNH